MFETLSNWQHLVQWVLAAFVGWVWWSIKSRFSTKEDHVALEKRVLAVENAVKNLPTIKDHHELIIGLTKLNGGVEKMDTSMAAVQRQVNRIEDYLMQGKHE